MVSIQAQSLASIDGATDEMLHYAAGVRVMLASIDGATDEMHHIEMVHLKYIGLRVSDAVTVSKTALSFRENLSEMWRRSQMSNVVYTKSLLDFRQRNPTT